MKHTKAQRDEAIEAIMQEIVDVANEHGSPRDDLALRRLTAAVLIIYQMRYPGSVGGDK